MIVIVCGMHRSGTSALSGFLHENGVIMGRKEDFHPKPMKENQKGFFENRNFRKLNDKWLKEKRYKVKDWNNSPPHLYKKGPGPDKIEEAVKLIGKYDKNKIWGWKDPRNCLTLSYWLKASKGMERKVLVIRRDPESIGRSLQKRGNCSFKRGMLLAIEYVNILDRHLSLYPDVERKEILFNDLINKQDETAENISKFLGIKIKSNGFIDKKLVHWN